MSPVSIPPTSRRSAGGSPATGGEAGFTIIELLTVLVLVGLISFVAMTGLEHVLDIRLRLSAFLDGVEAPVLVADWFRATIDGLVPDAPNGPDRFVGRPQQLTGLTLAPLNGNAGAPTRITWEVVLDDSSGRTALRYRNGTDPAMTIASWPGSSGGLRYCGPDLHCHETWPPDQQAAPLPLLVELDAVKGNDPWPILAAPRGDRSLLRTRSNRP